MPAHIPSVMFGRVGRALGAILLGVVLAACGGGGGPMGVDAASAVRDVSESRKAVLAQGAELTEAEALAYIASYPDLILAFGTDTTRAREHWATGGRQEGRTILFKPYTYIASYPDLITVFGTDAETATRQFIRNGIAQNRKLSFDGLKYLASNPDVAARLGLDPDEAARDYVATGYALGRPVDFSALRYVARYTDLIAAYGVNVAAATVHYLERGLSEGRTLLFDTAQYLANYADLRSVYGNDIEAATAHYILAGRAEGRTDVRPNRAPVAAIAAPVSNVLLIGATLTLDGTGSSDPDGDAIRHAWTLRSRPAGSTAQLGSPTSAQAALSVDVGGSYVVELVVSDGASSSPPATIEIKAGTPVSGQLAASGSWTRAHSPIVLVGPLGIPSGVTLTVEEGVEVIGGGQRIQVQGALIVSGTAQAPVTLAQVRVVPAGAAGPMGHLISITHARLNGGTLYAPTGNAVHGNLVLRDSHVDSEEYIYLWYPTGQSVIERNRFVRGRISYGTSGAGAVTIRNNLFTASAAVPHVSNWAASDASTSVVTLNTFASKANVAVELPAGYGSARLSAVGNYWGTIDRGEIAQMIFDRNDDLTSAGTIAFEPFLTAPHPDTPQ